VVVPVTSNGMIGQLPDFEQVVLTQIGSPYVIDGMARCGATKVVGFEPNGGFLLGFQAGAIAPLMTRDCVLPIVAVLGSANRRRVPLSALVSELPAWYSAADRLQNIDRPRAEAFLQSLIDDTAQRSAFFTPFGGIGSVDLTDGLRITLPDGVTILHLRLSGNAPEFRTYAQASDRDRATRLQQALMQRVAQALDHQT
jgi:phosphomannomutase